MSVYAVGKKAFGFCDRCGFRYPLDELRKETVNAFKIDSKVCEECWDPDHPQNKLGKENPSDPQALFDPRPDTGLTASRYGDSILWDFDSDREYWMGLAGQPPWSGGEIVLTTSSSGLDVYVERRDFTDSSAVSVDASTYKYIRVRVKRTSEWVSSASTDGWLGRLWWNDDGAYTSSKSKDVLQPVWTEMGDPYHILTWDLSQDSNWTGTIDKLKINFNQIGSGTWTSVGSYTIDYIRAEES